ncbi:MAG: peroxidase [Pseudomonadota bacterium]
MAFIETVRPNAASGAVHEMYARQQNHWGYVPNYAKVFCHRPETLARWGRLLAEIRRPVEDYRFELVTFVVAHELRHSACSLTHGEQLASWVGEDAVKRIARGREEDVLSAKDAAIVAYARAIARDAFRVTAGQVEALTQHHGLTDEEIYDIAAIAAGRCFFTKLLDALGVEPDSTSMDIPAGLREILSVGRPISPRPVETLATNDAA